VTATDTTLAEDSSPSPLCIGEVVAERYRVESVLGEGGMGVVYRVEHTHLRKSYALKVLRPECASTHDVVARFEREAIAAGRIESEHVVAATDFGRLADSSFFLVMEYVRGRTLRSVLQGGAVEPARALRILRGIVAALGAAHALSIVHRDVKPENVMLVELDGDPDFVKVLDFGIAKADGLGGGDRGDGSTALTKAGAIIGTLEYMSPEQALGQRVDGRSDLYSAGVILFEMLTGKCPFRGGAGTMWRQHVVGEVPELPVDVAARIDPRLGAILRRMLATRPEDRFENATAVVVALDDHEREASPQSDTARPSLQSAHGLTTPVALRVRRSLLAGRDTAWGWARRAFAERGALLRGTARVRGAIRQVLSDREELLRRATWPRLALALVAVVTIVTIAIALFGGGDRGREASHATLRSTDPIPVVSPESHSASSDFAAGADDLPVGSLPPPPSPSSSSPEDEEELSPTGSAQPAPSQRPPRRTGPGGIYVPPPSQWFQ
jgi:serine/threonine-protein kinase